MWSLRTAAKHVTAKTCTLRSATVGACCTNLELPNNNIDEKQNPTSHPISIFDHPQRTSATRAFSSSTLFFHSRNLSSQIDTKLTNNNAEELKGFSDLDTDSEEKDVEDELVPESDDVTADEEESALEEEELIKKSYVSKRFESPLYELILSSPSYTLEESLEKWVKEGNEIKKEEVIGAVKKLRKKTLFGKAFQLMKWLEKSEHYEFTDMEYSSLVDLHAKVRGLYEAEKFLAEIPQSMRTERVYRSLLASCVSVFNVLKSEKTFNKMRDLNFPPTAFTCNQLLLLYKRTDKKKIADVLLMMERENVKPTLFTYKVLIDTKGLVGDIPAMEQLLDTMKEDGIEPDIYIKYVVAKHYIRAGFTEKAEKMAKEIEDENLSDKLLGCKFLLYIYQQLGKPDDVERVWKACGVNPTMDESLAIMRAWANLGKLEEAEKVFDEMSKRYKKLPQKCYNVMISIYADKKMLDKAKAVMNRMSDENIRIGPVALDMLVAINVKEGDVEKADSMLQSWVQKNQKMQNKPMYQTYMILLEAYAKKGDYHNAEKMLYLTRQIGYSGRLRMYELVLSAYFNAKVPAYGFRDRLKADNMFPNKNLTELLFAVEPFKKAPVTGVLE
ncbi:pentatricopeptide repeat-containing protein [Carex littledalei]|uniref:Pentatricopeptide repeat-containing protein n=1 Tax=Carex littledalei TaxID=544730 RepID=A0A833VTB1_9POAL|nr:pentatricopeptide repeat-containing protein [Carex littledalei]